MNETDILCPFCNSRIDGLVEQMKPTCPRCDAPLPANVVAKLNTAAPPKETAPRPAAPGKTRTIAAILGIMALMAAITTGFALWTKEFRRQNDLKKGFIATLPASQEPEEMSVLGLVPARCNVLGAVNLADVRANPVAKKALFEPPPRSIEWLTDRLKDVTGMSPNDLDQVAVGVEMADKLPKIFVLVQTRAAYDPQAILKAFAPAKAQLLRGRPLVRFPLWHVGDGVVWCVTDRHLAFLFQLGPAALDELEAIPVRPRLKLEGSPEAVRTLVKERVDKQSLAWLAAADLGSSAVVDFLGLAGAKVEPYRPLLATKAVTISVKTDTDVVVLGQALPKSASEAETLAAKLRDADWRGEASKKVAPAPADAAAPWVSLQLRYEAGKIRELLERGPG
jgi:hypothetical protein